MTDAHSHDSRADENLVGDIVEKHGHAEEPLLVGLTPAKAVGQVLLLDYDTTTLAVHDYHKERAGGLARGMFLVAGPVPDGEDATLVLLRVTGAKRLANRTTTDEARLTAVRDTIGRELWSESLTTWIADEIALGGVEARILGTLTFHADEGIQFAEDIANYYSARGAFAWKPEGELCCKRIVNLTHRGNNLDLDGTRNSDQLGYTGSRRPDPIRVRRPGGSPTIPVPFRYGYGSIPRTCSSAERLSSACPGPGNPTR